MRTRQCWPDITHLANITLSRNPLILPKTDTSSPFLVYLLVVWSHRRKRTRAMGLFVVFWTRLYLGVLPPVKWSISFDPQLYLPFPLPRQVSPQVSGSLKFSAHQGVEFKLSIKVFKYTAPRSPLFQFKPLFYPLNLPFHSFPHRLPHPSRRDDHRQRTTSRSHPLQQRMCIPAGLSTLAGLMGSEANVSPNGMSLILDS